MRLASFCSDYCTTSEKGKVIGGKGRELAAEEEGHQGDLYIRLSGIWPNRIHVKGPTVDGASF